MNRGLIQPRCRIGARERALGVLLPWSETDPAAVGYVKALREELAHLGWREDENLKIELRWSSDEIAGTRAYARELVELRPALIVAPVLPSRLCAKQRARSPSCSHWCPIRSGKDPTSPNGGAR